MIHLQITKTLYHICAFLHSLDPKETSTALHIAEAAISRKLFADILRLMAELQQPPDPLPA